jgi:hypothetical protein
MIAIPKLTNRGRSLGAFDEKLSRTVSLSQASKRNLQRRRRMSRRIAAAMFDLVVAAVLTTTLVGTLTTSAIRSIRLMKDTRDQHLALEELSNQLERLTALEDDDRSVALETLVPSDEVKHSLINAKLEAEVIEDKQGKRLLVTLNWDRDADATPKQLVGWIKVNAEDPTP